MESIPPPGYKWVPQRFTCPPGMEAVPAGSIQREKDADLERSFLSGEQMRGQVDWALLETPHTYIDRSEAERIQRTKGQARDMLKKLGYNNEDRSVDGQLRLSNNPGQPRSLWGPAGYDGSDSYPGNSSRELDGMDNGVSPSRSGSCPHCGGTGDRSTRGGYGGGSRGGPGYSSAPSSSYPSSGGAQRGRSIEGVTEYERWEDLAAVKHADGVTPEQLGWNVASTSQRIVPLTSPNPNLPMYQDGQPVQNGGGYAANTGCNHSAVAAELYNGMKGFGTKETQVMAALGQVRSQQDWQQVQDAFFQQHGDMYQGDLKRSLESDLTKSEEQQAKQILAQNGVSWDGGYGRPAQGYQQQYNMYSNTTA